MSLRYKIVLFIFLPIIVISYFTIKYIDKEAEANLREGIIKDNIAKTERIKSKIDTNMLFFVRHIKTLSRLLKEDSKLSDKEYMLRAYMDGFKHLIDLTLISRNSLEITRFNKYHVVKNKGSNFYFNDNFYKYPLLHEDIFLGNVRLSKDTGEPIFDISVPVVNRFNGKTWAVLKATFSGKLNQDYLLSELKRYMTIETINIKTKKKILSFGKKYYIPIQKIIDNKDKNYFKIRNLSIFNQIIKMPEEEIIVYIIIPQKVTQERLNTVKKEYIGYFYSAVVIFFLLLFIILSMITKNLSNTANKIKSLSHDLSKESDGTDLKRQSDEIENLNESIILLETALKESKQKDAALAQQSKLASMGEMIGSIAHQWRQPLNAISINIQNLKYDFEDNRIDKAFLSSFIEKNKKTIMFMSKTIDDFRNFFVVDKMKKRFNIKDAIDETVSMQRAQLENHNIKLTIKGETFSINSFKNEFQQVVLNLINNSKDAFIEKEDTLSREIIVLLGKNGTINITDNAGGIPKNIIDRIFEPYFTTKEQGKGTGMGLYMSKMIINNMGGEITASNINGGVEFFIDVSKCEVENE